MMFRADPPLQDWPALAGGGAIITGHQPWLWHPGILAKYLAADAAMAKAGQSGTPLRQMVVDQDVQDALRLVQPRVEGASLKSRDVALGRLQADVPAGCQPPAELSAERLAATGLDHAAEKAPPASTLARQVTHLVEAMVQPWLTRPMVSEYATELADAAWFAGEIAHLRDDAERCAALYNEAVNSLPGAGVPRLIIEPYRVELPLWRLSWGGPRQRVYADLSDAQPWLVTEDGRRCDADDPEGQLVPRALLMTAWLRRRPEVGLFVHGTGGGVYDRITPRWWQAWRGETLCSIAVATADVTLDFDVPAATKANVERAVWYAHHLPHNLDRALRLQSPLVARKQQLLAHMDDDRDRVRRRGAFAELHRINLALLGEHPAAVAEAQQAVTHARQGLQNAALQQKRDWSLVWYPPEKIKQLRDAVWAAAGA